MPDPDEPLLWLATSTPMTIPAMMLSATQIATTHAMNTTAVRT